MPNSEYLSKEMKYKEIASVEKAFSDFWLSVSIFTISIRAKIA